MFGRIRTALMLRKLQVRYGSDDRDVYYEYQAGEEEEVLVRQDYIRAEEIVCGKEAISEQDFPWHGHSYQDFLDVTNRLQQLLPEILDITGEKEARRFRKKHKDIYDAYYQRPIHVLLENGKYKFLTDGRHRIFAAKQINGVIPVFVVEYAVVREMPVESYIERDCMRCWQF